MTTQRWTFRILKWSKSQENLFFFFSSFAVDVVPKPSTLGRRSPMPLYVLTEDVSPPSSFSFNKNNTQQWHSVWSPELYKMICYSVTWSLKLSIKNQHPLKTSPQSHRQVFGEKKNWIKKTSNSDNDDDDNVNLILIFSLSVIFCNIGRWDGFGQFTNMPLTWAILDLIFTHTFTLLTKKPLYLIRE